MVRILDYDLALSRRGVLWVFFPSASNSPFWSWGFFSLLWFFWYFLILKLMLSTKFLCPFLRFPAPCIVTLPLCGDSVMLIWAALLYPYPFFHAPVWHRFMIGPMPWFVSMFYLVWGYFGVVPRRWVYCRLVTGIWVCMFSLSSISLFVSHTWSIEGVCLLPRNRLVSMRLRHTIYPSCRPRILGSRFLHSMVSFIDLLVLWYYCLWSGYVVCYQLCLDLSSSAVHTFTVRYFCQACLFVIHSMSSPLLAQTSSNWQPRYLKLLPGWWMT